MKKRRDVASVLVKVGDECLLCKRAPSQSYPNTWSIPGGGVNKGEEPKEAAAREFYEETDNEISVDDLVFRAVMPKVKNGKTKGLMYIYTLQPNEKIYPDLENAEDGHEHSECKYFQVDKLDKMEMGTNLYKVVRKIFGLDWNFVQNDYIYELYRLVETHPNKSFIQGIDGTQFCIIFVKHSDEGVESLPKSHNECSREYSYVVGFFSELVL